VRKAGKFRVEWVDGTTGTLRRDEFVEPRQAAFYTVPVRTVLSLPRRWLMTSES
jgi:hypothetical protein